MFRADNSFSVLVGKSVARTASVQITDPATTSTYIASGEILFLGENDAVLTAGDTISNHKSIRIVQGDGSTNPLVFTPRIVGTNVVAFADKAYVAPQEQTYYVGYNGSSGSIDLINSNRYVARVSFKHDTENWSEQVNMNHAEYTSDATATQLEVAQAFARAYARQYPASNSDIKVERVCDGTFTVLGGSSTLAVVNGSTTATASSASHALVAGDVVRIGGTGATVPVYVVASVSGTTVELDSAYQGTTGTVANANVGEMSSITAWGLKYTGKALSFSVRRFKYIKVAFDLTIQNFGATTVTKSQEASKGNGTYEEVAELEYFAQGFEGWLENRNATPYQAQPRSNATSGTIYNMITIRAYDASDFSPISGTKPSPFDVYIFLPVGASQTTQIKAQANPWFASLPSAFANITIV